MLENTQFICLCIIIFTLWYIEHNKRESELEEIRDKIFELETQQTKHNAEQKKTEQDYRNSLRILAREIKKWNH